MVVQKTEARAPSIFSVSFYVFPAANI